MKKKFNLNYFRGLHQKGLAFLLFSLLAITGFSQPMFFNSTFAGNTNAIPFSPSAATFQRAQFVWGPGNFPGSYAGVINTIYFYAGSSNTTTFTNFIVNMGTAGSNPLNASTWFTTGMQNCITSSTATFTTATNAWVAMKLQTPISYDPTKYLVIDISSTGYSGGFSINQQAVAGLSPGRVYGTATAPNPAGSDNNTPTFGFDVARGGDDAAITAIAPPLCNPKLVATYVNAGTNTIDSVNINWSVNGVFQNATKYKNAVPPAGKPVSFTLSPDYPMIDGNTYTVKVWTSLPNGKKDTINGNDTIKYTFAYQGPSSPPTVKDIVKCGPGTVTLSATTFNKADSVIWYNSASGGSSIAKGRNAKSPSLSVGVNTFYAEASKISKPLNFANAMVPSTGFGSTYSGGMANITPKTGLVIDSFCVLLTANIQNATFNVYMRVGGYVGYETNAAAWTKIVNNTVSRVRPVFGWNGAHIKIPEVQLQAGITYGFYITSTPTTPTSPWNNANVAGGITISNSEMTVFQDKALVGGSEFTGVQPNYPMTWQTFYRTMNCPSARTPLKVTVNPSPFGAAWIKSTPFQSPVAILTNGTVTNPDVVANGDQIAFELSPPTGFTTANYGSKWTADIPVVKSKKGRIIPQGPTTWTYTPPSGGTPGRILISPTSALTDTTLIITQRLQDMGPYFCDSTITRNIFVAPRPVANFKFPQPVCDGENVLFSDLSKISSGFIGYKWDFGTGVAGDTATTSDAVFKFPTHGSYDVTLTTKSLPYGYIETKTLKIVVNEVPKIDYKIVNACEKTAVTFKNNSTISAGIITYDWNFGDPSTTADRSTLKDPSWMYTNPGGYKVTLKASAGGCTAELTKNANQFAIPVAKFNTPALMCDKSDIQFTNASTIKSGNMGYTWDFGDKGVSNFANPIHQYDNNDPRTVKMKVVSEFGCADSISKVISLSEAPNADFTWGAACNLTATSFEFTGSKPTGAETTFNWDFAGEGSTTLQNPSKLFSDIGKKLITLSLVSNNGCSDVTTKEINVKLQSKANFEIEDVCEDNDAVFINKSIVSSGNLNYNWKFGDASNSSAQSPRHRYTIDGESRSFNVTLVAVVPGGCSDSTTKQVTVNAKPISKFTATTAGRLVYFKAEQPGNTLYQWRFGDGGSANGPTVQNTQYEYLQFPTGKYNACLAVVNAAGCFSETCQAISITGGVDKITKLTGVKIYPNPNKGNFTVTVEDPKSDISIAVYNLLGDVVKVIETSSLKSTYSIDLNVANGVYMVKVTNGGLTSTQKITVNK